jgi:hypothetical protein
LGCDLLDEQRDTQTTMTDTPRTDEQINGKPCTRFALMAGDSLRDATVQSEFARTLERELNEARDRQWANSIHSCHNECARPMCVLRRERDEWKEKAERLQAACNKWSESDMLLTNCPDCRKFRGHGHECKSEPPQPPIKNCRKCFGDGQVEIQSGPYMRECPECGGSGKQKK